LNAIINNINPKNVKVGDRIRLIRSHDIHADVRQGYTGTIFDLTLYLKACRVMN